MIEAIFIAKENRDDQQQVDGIELIKGKGIVGDRNFDKSKWPGQNITFIELEEIEKYNSCFRQNIALSDTRRNVITKNIRLNDLVGKEFRIGEVLFKGVEICEPCAYLGELLENNMMPKKNVIQAFFSKGGLRADVLSDGHIGIGMNFEFG